MSLQSQVFTSTAPGVPGSKADMNIFDYHPNTLTAEGDITVGTFVARGTDPATQGKYGADPIGLVERNIVYPNYELLEDGSEIIVEGETLTIATSGAFWVVTQDAVTAGMAVQASATDGTVSGALGTAVPGWFFETAGAAGETVIIKRS
jgi:hypothetical protein